MRVSDFLRLLFRPSGPRREAADKLDVKLAAAAQDNLDAIKGNLRAVQELVKDTLDRVEGHENGHDRETR